MLDQLVGKSMLVTGASGFIGQHLIQRLQALPDVSLIALSRRSRPQTIARVNWLQSDLQGLTPEFWQRHKIEKVDVIFHLGAYTPKSAREANAVDTIYSDNLLGTRALLASLPNAPERIVYSSTLDVYAPPRGDEVMSEASPIAPPSLYGASKFFGEQLVKTYAAHYNSAYSILRYGHIYGPGEMAYQKLIPEAIRNILAGRSPVIYGDGSTLRDFLYVDDAIEATLRAAVHTSKQLGPINVVRGESVSLREIVAYLVACADNLVTPQFLHDKSNGHSLHFDNQYMREMLGRWDLTPLSTGLQAEYEYFQQYAV